MPRATIEPPFYPIIYVRGYAGSESEVEETVATPYMGFNLGSTKVRQTWEKRIVRYIFESPLVRLMKDHGYRDVYMAGDELVGKGSIPARSVVIYRYYDQVSEAFNEDPERPQIPEYAEGLASLIEAVRDSVCDGDPAAKAKFKCYLVAHSMGGLICRSFLQKVGKPAVRKLVDKVFTYATPHNGIDVRVLGNIPGFFSGNNKNNFNRNKMKGYLGLPDGSDRVDHLNGKFDPERFFSLVGTNCDDYEVAAGWAKRVVGPMSDGLVRIVNATVHGTPRSFVHRSHSGHYGIVNSEEGYQNLSRFLFGDVRVDGTLEVEEITLPLRVQKAKDKGKTIRASYNFEVTARPRGARYDLHQRVTEHGSAILRSYDEMLYPERTAAKRPRHPRLFSLFLDSQRITRGRSLVFHMEVGVLVPEYEIDGFLMFDSHIEGSYIFRDGITLAAKPPANEKEGWSLRYGWDSDGAGRATKQAGRTVTSDGRVEFQIPVATRSRARPGLKAVLRISARAWND